MSERIFSPSWYRVEKLKPRLRSHARIHRHEYDGQLWYVLQDPSSGRHHRLSPAAHTFLGLTDGRRSVGEIWHLVSTRLGDEAPGFLRPGMEGVGKVEIGRRRLGWIWLHPLSDWLRLWSWSWLP